jgi:hypothetical protein
MDPSKAIALARVEYPGCRMSKSIKLLPCQKCPYFSSYQRGEVAHRTNGTVSDKMMDENVICERKSVLLSQDVITAWNEQGSAKFVVL